MTKWFIPGASLGHTKLKLSPKILFGMSDIINCFALTDIFSLILISLMRDSSLSVKFLVEKNVLFSLT